MSGAPLKGGGNAPPLDARVASALLASLRAPGRAAPTPAEVGGDPAELAAAALSARRELAAVAGAAAGRVDPAARLRFLLSLDAAAGRPFAPSPAEALAAWREGKRWRVWVHGDRPAMLDDVGIRDVFEVAAEVGGDPATWWAIDGATGAAVEWARPTEDDLAAARDMGARAERATRGDRLSTSRDLRTALDAALARAREAEARWHGALEEARSYRCWRCGAPHEGAPLGEGEQHLVDELLGAPRGQEG